MCYVVRNFLPWKIGESHQKSAPETKEKEKTPDHTKGGNSNALAHGPIIRVLAVKIISPSGRLSLWYVFVFLVPCGAKSALSVTAIHGLIGYHIWQ